MEADRVSFLDRQLKVNKAEDAEEIVQKLDNTSHVKTFELRGNTVGMEGGKAIADALERHSELKNALWSDMFTGKLKTEIPPILETLCRAMMTAGVELEELDLSDNAFGPIGADGIQEFLRSSSAFTLERLKLNNCGLGAGGETIAKCLMDCYKSAKENGRTFQLKTFVAGRNRLENPRAFVIAQAFRMLGTLEEIEMYQDGINPDGIIVLAASLTRNKNLRILNLSDNTFTVRGAIKMAEALKTLDRLEVINFSDCLCRDAGSRAILEALSAKTHPNLKEIHLDGSEITAQGAEALIGMMKDRLPHTKLSIGTNSFGSRFDDLVELAAQHGNIELGSRSDDEGSTGEETDDEGGDEQQQDEATEDDEANSTTIPEIEAVTEPLIEDVLDRCDSTSLGLIIAKDDFREQLLEVLKNDICTTRNPLLTARVLAMIAAISAHGTQNDDLISCAVAIVTCAKNRKLRPLTPLNQIVNHLCAFSGIGNVKVEAGTKSQKLMPDHVKKLFQLLLSRGILTGEDVISIQ
ncbi:hypothetical protein L596_025527 [Steinernema carpocapsae]|uniref:Ran-GTPase activating protein 1 C-terminal domain-containing protein n=1 Tax=Steinernema carpocapsae TaxID=34508 RepID=A0A4U5M818_STECR|nr:hypothetical protein L596_025527 [Steinernema carpocapsae]